MLGDVCRSKANRFDHSFGHLSRSKVRCKSVFMCQNYVVRVKNDYEKFLLEAPQQIIIKREPEEITTFCEEKAFKSELIAAMIKIRGRNFVKLSRSDHDRGVKEVPKCNQLK